MSTFTSILKFVGKNVAAGAASKIGGDAMGFVLDKIFGSEEDPVISAIQKLGKQLDAIQGTLSVMDGELHAISSELQKVVQNQLYMEWSTVDIQIQKCIVQIQTQYQRYIDYAKNPKSTTKEEVEQLISDILNTDNGAEVSLVTISNFVVGSDQAKGCLELWADMVAPMLMKKESPYLSYKLAVEQYMNYYSRILVAQLNAAHLLVEAFNKQGNHPLAITERDKYRKLISSQEAQFIRNLDVLVASFISSAGEEPVFFDPGFGGFVYCSYELIDCIQTYSAGAGYEWSYYRPSIQHSMAEEILAAAYAMDEDERRIVVYMIYPPKTPYLNVNNIPLDNVEVQLVDAAEPDGVGIPASHVQSITVSSDDKLPGKRFIKRFIYENLQDGAYRLKNQNGQNGLLDLPTIFPMKSENLPTLQFQHPKFLNYILTVDPAKQFDFMEFVAYRFGIASLVLDRNYDILKKAVWA
ncbi:hypothetical protein NDI49_06045 [Trichocoleus sp. ST-U3]